ncbi:MAG: carbonic anhydrase [Rikenellaceae bacterium]
MKNYYIKALLVGAMFATLQSCTGAQTISSEETKAIEKIEYAPINTPDEAIAALIKGNKEFMEGNVDVYNQSLEEAKTLVDGQAPFATIIGCSDSRVPIELLFNQGFGDLFIIRNAGNCVKVPTAEGSIFYGIAHLHTKVIVVLGHTNCGAITGLVNAGDDAHPHGHDHDHHSHAADAEMEAYVNDMLNIIDGQIPGYKGSHELNEAIDANVVAQVELIKSLPGVQQKIDEGEIKVVGAIYDIATGKVTFSE